jgi:hypothetical protein
VAVAVDEVWGVARDCRIMEYSWGPLIPFCMGGFSVSNMGTEREWTRVKAIVKNWAVAPNENRG